MPHIHHFLCLSLPRCAGANGCNYWPVLKQSKRVSTGACRAMPNAYSMTTYRATVQEAEGIAACHLFQIIPVYLAVVRFGSSILPRELGHQALNVLAGQSWHLD